MKHKTLKTRKTRLAHRLGSNAWTLGAPLQRNPYPLTTLRTHRLSKAWTLGWLTRENTVAPTRVVP